MCELSASYHDGKSLPSTSSSSYSYDSNQLELITASHMAVLPGLD